MWNLYLNSSFNRPLINMQKILTKATKICQNLNLKYVFSITLLSPNMVWLQYSHLEMSIALLTPFFTKMCHSSLLPPLPKYCCQPAIISSKNSLFSIAQKANCWISDILLHGSLRIIHNFWTAHARFTRVSLHFMLEKSEQRIRLSLLTIFTNTQSCSPGVSILSLLQCYYSVTDNID